MLRRATYWAIATGALILILISATDSSSYQACKGEQEKHYADPHKPDHLEAANTFLVCEGDTIDANGELITAWATIAIAAFTFTLWRTSTNQGRLTLDQIALARKEFVSSHRPRIRIRHIRGAREGNRLRIVYVMSNTGNTKATITRHEIVLEARNILQPLQSRERRMHETELWSDAIEATGLLAAGENLPYSITTDEAPKSSLDDESVELRIRITVQFLDDLSPPVKRTTQAYRRYDRKSCGFRRFKESEFDSEYEYED